MVVGSGPEEAEARGFPPNTLEDTVDLATLIPPKIGDENSAI